MQNWSFFAFWIGFSISKAFLPLEVNGCIRLVMLNICNVGLGDRKCINMYSLE